VTKDLAAGRGHRAPAGSPVFELVGATVAFDGATVLDVIDLRIDAGSFVALLGANGSGKTTLVRCLLGLQTLTSGKVLVHGTPLAGFRQWQRIAFVPQRLPAATGVPISVLELVTSATISPRTRWRRNRRAARSAALEALDLVGLADRRHSRVDVLSGGQQRRVMIARALAEGADTLVLDEPMAGVDLANQSALAEVLASLDGRTIVMVAHGLGTVTDLVTRAIVLESGRMVHDGPTAPQGWADLDHHSDRRGQPTLLEG
jgi:zinc transport system ATP-binding protein